MFTALIEYLTGLSALTALVAAANIQPVAQRKINTGSYITITRVSRTDSQDLGGGSTYCEVDSFEIDVVTNSVTKGEAILEVLRKNLDGYQQQNMGTTAPVYIGSTRMRNSFDYSSPSEIGKDGYAFHEAPVFDFGYLQADADV